MLNCKPVEEQIVRRIPQRGIGIMANGGFWKWAVALVVSVWVGFTVAVQLLIFLMVIDFATGLLCAARHGEISSKKSFRGMFRKTAVLIVVEVMYLLQREAFIAAGLHIAIDLAQTVAFAYVWSELVSILENCVCMGAPLPDVLKKLMAITPKLEADEEERLS